MDGTEKEISTLDKLGTKKDAIVISIDCKDKALRHHILDMGITPGVEVTLVKTAPMGDPLEIRLRGYELTIRKSDAANITISEIHETDTVRKRTFKNFSTSERTDIGEIIDTPKKNKRKPTKKKVKFALVGNQNCGKTTLFNQLTGSNQHVGNFPGVTVDMTEGIVKEYSDVTIADLPGIYSLSPYSKEEIVTRDFILNQKPDGIINIVDATNIERNLYLTMQLIQLNIPMVIALNMMDEVHNNGGSIDINGLEAALGIPVIPISAAKNEGIDELVEHAINVARYEEKPKRLDFCNNEDKNEASIHRCIHSIVHLIEDHAHAVQIPERFAATKLVEGDKLILDILALDENELKTCRHIIKEMEQERGIDKEAALADMRFSFITGLCDKYVQKPEDSLEYKITVNADKILTGKYTAIISFFTIMALIFYFTFGPLGMFLSEIMDFCIQWITQIADSALTAYGLNGIVHSLIIDGIFAGVGSVLSFLPIIVVLFFFLSILEDSGYMARVAFVMDKMLRKIGLSGRSFVPMLIGFGCSVPAIMATRTLPSERDRKMTILLTPFMSCSAKLPIYSLFTAAFFKEHRVLVVMSLYLIGIIVGIIFALFMKKFMFRGKPVPFVMELPNYRLPSPINVYRLIVQKAKDFATKAFTIIFWATIIIWFLQTFDAKLNLVTNSADSLIALLGNCLVPIFSPLGITDWRVSTAFITGFMAKESVVSTLSVLMGGNTENLPLLFTNLTAFVFLVFCLLYTPCVATIATVRRELGKRYVAFIILVQCSIAWFVAYLVYILGNLILKLI